MRKQAHQLARGLQQQLQAALASHGAAWTQHVPQVSLDAWTALVAWHQAGEPVTRLTDEAEDAILAQPLPADLPLATARVRRGGAIAVIMPERSLWIILARLAAQQPVPVQDGWTLGRRQAILAYVRNDPDSRGIAAGYYSLEDHLTLGSLHLRPGTTLRADGTTRPLGEADTADDDYRVLLALHQLYLRPAHDPR